jgi:photosystem II stability/assembly factor-like uncharacterized protein
MPNLQTLVVAALLAVAGNASAEVRLVPQDSGVKVRLRGISAVTPDIAWASGREGTVLRTVDGGKHWQAIGVPGAEELDFRDIEAFDADVAVALSIGPGEASRVYRTVDGGKHWQLALQNRDPRAFFDCMAFEGQRGWMLGDPVDGRFQLYATGNGGRDWRLLADGPEAGDGEAAFAASGTCIARVRGALIVATGGSSARLHVLRDGRRNWQVVDSGMDRDIPAAGVFSLAASRNGVFAVGGDYRSERTPGNASTLKGRWRPAVQREVAPRGYRSGAACAKDAAPCIAVGPSGVDAWNGRTWRTVSDTGYDAIDVSGTTGWASGDAGRIARIEIGDD